MIVVSNTSPVLNLARIGRLQLLPALYNQLVIPTAVYAELVRPVGNLPPAIDLSSMTWLSIAAPKDHNRVEQLCEELDLGEAEAIVLATECRADLLLIDERRGRRIAKTIGIAVIGLLGLLADAKRTGLIEQAKPVLDELIYKAKFWIGPVLYKEFLTELNEE